MDTPNTQSDARFREISLAILNIAFVPKPHTKSSDNQERKKRNHIKLWGQHCTRWWHNLNKRAFAGTVIGLIRFGFRTGTQWWFISEYNTTISSWGWLINYHCFTCTVHNPMTNIASNLRCTCKMFQFTDSTQQKLFIWYITSDGFITAPFRVLTRSISRLQMIRAPSQYKDRLIYVWRFPC